MPNPACLAYEAYRAGMNALPSSTTYLIGWDYLPEEQKQVWWLVVKSLSRKEPYARPLSTD